MDEFLQQVVDNMRKNEFEVVELRTAQEACDYLNEHINAGKTVGVGGSVSVRATGILEKLQEKGCTVYSHWGVPKKEVNPIRRKAIGADVFGMQVSQLMPSSSPVKGTMTDGIWADAAEQIWIDGNGKRFVNEYAERDVLAKASLALDNGIFYIIYAGRGDISKPEQMLTGTDYNARVAGMVEGGHIWYGSTLAELAQGGTVVAACQNALRANQIDPQQLPDFVRVVPAGVVEIAQRQEEGFSYIKP